MFEAGAFLFAACYPSSFAFCLQLQVHFCMPIVLYVAIFTSFNMHLTSPIRLHTCNTAVSQECLFQDVW